MPNASRGVTRHEGFRGDLGIAGNVLSGWLARLVDAGLLTRLPYRAERRPDTPGVPAHPGREPRQFPAPGLRRPHHHPKAYCEHCRQSVHREDQL